MTQLRSSCLTQLSSIRDRISVFALLTVVFLVASPAAAFDFDVNGTKATVGGYLKLMMIYDTDGTTDAGPMDGDVAGGYDPFLDGDPLGRDEGSDFRMTARESRLFVKTNTDTDKGVLNTHIEGDFYGDSPSDSHTWSNSTTLRLRHAYGSMTSGSHVILAGQTWSTFMDLAAGVPDMDIGGDPGFCFVRQPMVRYQYNLRPGHYIAVALEDPDRGLTSAGPISYVTNAGTSEEVMPDLVLKHFFANKRMTLSPRVVLRQFDLTDAATDEGGTALGWGVALSGSFTTGPARFSATFMYGDGLGRYGGLGNIAGAGLTADNDIETVGFMSANGGMTLALSDTVKWAIGAGWAQNDDEDYDGTDPILTTNATKTAIGYHTNVKWQVTRGFEWAIGAGFYQREIMDGTEGDMLRFQSYFKYSF